MSAGSVVSQLEALVSRVESMSSRLEKIRPTNDQQDELRKLGKRMDSAWATVSAVLAKFNNRSDKVFTLANAVRATQEYQTITSPIFMILRRNLELIFVGPRDSALDSAQIKVRKKKARTRCELLRSQHPHVILMWAMAIPPSTWSASAGMSDNTFDFVIDDTSTERIPMLSPEIVQKLQAMEEEEPLNTCDRFREFMSGLKSTLVDQRENANASLKRPHRVMESGPAAPVPPTENNITTAQEINYRNPGNPSRHQLPSLRQIGFTAPAYYPNQKRGGNGYISNINPGYDRPFVRANQPQLHENTIQRSTQSQEGPAGVNSQLPSAENREAKYICTNAPASIIEKLPEPFKTAVLNSKLWKVERGQGLETTGCLATLFPKDDTQDVSLTIWCANEEGYRLYRMYGMEPTMSFF
ncbi:hypothetical protein LOZ65_006787 [Ophidiomyces ophidiicola]|nr:hypothetical protein LOZ65_006787 [Ophidiomyces ophidiicola]